MAETSKSTAIVNWADEMAKFAAAVAKTEAPSSSYISLRSGVLSYQGQPVPNNKLSVVILDSAFEHTFYEGKYDPNNVRSPVCFAIQQSDNPMEMVPHELSAKKQADKCGDCPNLEWGSDPNGGRGKACQERRRLIMIPASSADKAENVLAAEVAIMKLPVTSVKVWGNYVNTVASLNRRPPFALVTEIGTIPDAKSQFKLTFKALSALSDDVLSAIMEKRKAVQPTLLKGYDPSAEETEAPAAAPGKGKKY
jgi:hypothetical protein